MSLFKVSLIVLILLILFGGIFFFQFSRRNLYKDQITIDKKTFNIQIVQKPLEMEHGLSGRAKIADDQGMLFLFPDKGDHAFWMKEMLFPLDILFIDDNKIVSISQNAPAPTSPTATLPLYRSALPSNKVLEINAGLAKKYDFKVGDTVTLPGK
jgi:uncharacterized membrane protein (UPF0127 family)